MNKIRLKEKPLKETMVLLGDSSKNKVNSEMDPGNNRLKNTTLILTVAGQNR